MSTATTTAKEEVMDLLRRLPDSASLEEIGYAIFMLQKAKLAREAIDRGEVHTHEEAREYLKEWLTE